MEFVKNQITDLETEIEILDILMNNNIAIALEFYTNRKPFILNHANKDENYYLRKIQERNAKIKEIIENEKKSERELKETTQNMQQFHISGIFFEIFIH